MVLRALRRRSLGTQLALDGAQGFPKAVDASAVPSLERGGQLALKPLAALRQFACAHFGFRQLLRCLQFAIRSIPAVMATVR